MFQSLRQRHRTVVVVMAAALVAAFGWSSAASASNGAATSATPAISSSAPAGATLPTIPSKLACAALVQNNGLHNSTVPDFGLIPDAPTRIESATDVAATATTPEYCDVKGYVQTQINFELKLPVSTWQGRYLQEGCGGFCGAIGATSFPTCDAQLGGDFAISSTDDGHETSQSTDALWAGGSQQARVDFGNRAVHVVAVASKAIQAAFYGTPPKVSYFQGCSDGGREGLSEAQRYPHDFNGIVAGAPANYMSIVPMWLAYEVDANTDANGNPILTSDKLVPLHNAVVAACDKNDGVLGDGLIGDPRDCHFNPASIECTATADPSTCLTAAQVGVVDKIYGGVVDKQGKLLDPRLTPRGSELTWAGWWIPVAASAPAPAGTPPTYVAKAFGESAAGYLSYPLGKGKALEDVKFTDAEWAELHQQSSIYDDTPKLQAFEKAGGKVLIYQGESDVLNPGSTTEDYYAALTKNMGGQAATEKFARLFMINGMGHCGGGPTPSSSDLVAAMVNWVENGQAPNQILVSDKNAATNETRTRPVYPYPLVPKYVGPDPVANPAAADDPANFVAAQPAVARSGAIDWIGEPTLLDQATAPSHPTAAPHHPATHHSKKHHHHHRTKHHKRTH